MNAMEIGPELEETLLGKRLINNCLCGHHHWARLEEVQALSLRQRTEYLQITTLSFLHRLLQMPQLEEVLALNYNTAHVITAHRRSIEKIDGPPVKPWIFNLALTYQAIKAEKNFNWQHPITSFLTYFFNQPFRLTLLHPSLNPGSICSRAFFRCLRPHDLSLTDFFQDSNIFAQLSQALFTRSNIIIFGEIGSGKTALLRSLAKMICPKDHTLVIEDTAEILLEADNFTYLTVKQGPPEEQQDGMKNYCHWALRLRPDRLILGEIRSGEVVPLLLMLSSGQRGIWATIHAASAKAACQRLGLLYQLYTTSQTAAGNKTLKKYFYQHFDLFIGMQAKRIETITFTNELSSAL